MLNPKRTVEELKELRALTADEDGAQRVAWTPMWLKARAWFSTKLKDLPVEHHLDPAGNNWVTLKGQSEKAQNQSVRPGIVGVPVSTRGKWKQHRDQAANCRAANGNKAIQTKAEYEESGNLRHPRAQFVCAE